MADIAVIGAGIAGLGCARELRARGHGVVVLERELTPGGRMRTDHFDGFRLDRGAQFIASGYRNLHALLGELGMSEAVRPLLCRRNAILRDGQLQPADWDAPMEAVRSRLLSFGAKLRLPRIALELVRHRAHLAPLHPERAAPIDGEDMASYLERIVGAEARDYLFAPAIAGTFDSDLEDLSSAFLLLVLRFVLSGFALQSVDGGLGSVTGAVASGLDLHLGCRVRSVESGPGGAEIRYEQDGGEHSLKADAVVVALPGPLVRDVCTRLTAGERVFFEQVRYVRGMIVHLLMDRKPAHLPFYGVSFPPGEGVDLYAMALDHHKVGAAPEGAGLLNVALTARAAARLWGATDAEVTGRVLADLAHTPVGSLRPFHSEVHRWDPMLPQFAPGYLKSLAAFLTRDERTPRLAFAGDYLVGPYTEAAFTSGVRAAADLCGQL